MSHSIKGAKSYERSGRSSDYYIMNHPSVIRALKGLYLPPKSDRGSLNGRLIAYQPTETEIEHVIAIHGGSTEIPLREGYPSSAIHFFQFTILHFKLED